MSHSINSRFALALLGWLLTAPAFAQQPGAPIGRGPAGSGSGGGGGSGVTSVCTNGQATGGCITTSGTISTVWLTSPNSPTGSSAYTIQGGTGAGSDAYDSLLLASGFTGGVTLPAATGTGFGAGCPATPANCPYWQINNQTGGTITMTVTTSTLDGASSVAIPTGQQIAFYSDGTNYHYISSAPSGFTGTGSVVRATSPTLVTPALGVATGTSLAIGGATIGSNALAITGSLSIAGVITTTGGNSVNSSSNFAIIGGGGYFWGSAFSLVSPSGGVLELKNSDGTTFDYLTTISGSGGTLQLGTIDGASPVAQTLQAQSVVAGNGNTAGATFTIGGSKSNGSGGGDFALQTTLASAASGTQNTLANAILMKGGTQLVELPAITNDAGLTDASVCEDTTLHGLHSGSGTLGICLGTSGRQFKTDFVPMQAGVDEIMKIPLWNYRYKTGYGDNGEREQYGPTAQDVEAVLPGLAGHDAKGNTINYDSGALLLIALHAIQQQQAEIDELKKHIQ